MLLLVLASGSLLAWVGLSHILFALVVSSIAFVELLFAAGWDTWRQTSVDGLAARGITAGDDTLPIYDPGLRRDWSPIVPTSVSNRISGDRNRGGPDASVARSRPAASSGYSSVGRVKPAGARTASGKTSSGKATRKGRQARRPVEVLSPGATITFGDEGREAGIDDLLDSLNHDLVGLIPVKKKVAEIGSLLLVDRARQRFGLSSTRPSLHMCFTGPPGTGKTTVALMMSEMLHRLGYLEQGHLVHAMRDDLVGQFIGHTAPKTKQVLARAMGGVLFIDEAYSLFREEDSKDFGQESVEIIMQVMENDRENLVVILAGYKDRMDRFFDSNPGMSSRVAHHLDFVPYETNELLAIGQLMLDRSSYFLSDEAKVALRDYLSSQRKQSRFANARSVRNTLEGARLRQAHRLASQPERPWRREDLMRLEAEDIVPGLDVDAASS